MKTIGKMVRTIWANNLVGVIWSVFAILLLGFLYQNTVGSIFVTIGTAFFSLLFAYESCWTQGFKDRNYVNYKRMEEDKWKGLKAGAFALIPHMLVVLAYYILLLTGTGFEYYNVFMRVWFLPWLVLIDQTVNAFPPVLFLIILLLPVVTGAAYQLGYHDFSLMEKLIYKNTGKKGAAATAKRRKKREARL